MLPLACKKQGAYQERLRGCASSGARRPARATAGIRLYSAFPAVEHVALMRGAPAGQPFIHFFGFKNLNYQ
jgi:hypothetical protein